MEDGWDLVERQKQLIVGKEEKIDRSDGRSRVNAGATALREVTRRPLIRPAPTA
jgi:hypothetical protein